MKKDVLNEIKQIKYFFEYKRGVVTSEQKNVLNEATIADDQGWNDIVKYYKIEYPTAKSWGQDVYKIIEIDHNGKKYILRNDGEILNAEMNKKFGDWSWNNNKPNLNFYYNLTTKSSGIVSGDDANTDCHKEFCDNKKIAKLGTKGYCVKKIQHLLLKSGLVSGIQLTSDIEGCKSDINKCDGVYGNNTKKAVVKFQTSKQISHEGAVGCQTWGYLI